MQRSDVMVYQITHLETGYVGRDLALQSCQHVCPVLLL